MVNNLKIRSCDLDIWRMTLILNRVHAVVKVHVGAKFHQTECSGSWVIMLTNEKTSDGNNTVQRSAATWRCVLHSSNEPGELSLHHDDSTVNIVVAIAITIITSSEIEQRAYVQKSHENLHSTFFYKRFTRLLGLIYCKHNSSLVVSWKTRKQNVFRFAEQCQNTTW